MNFSLLLVIGEELKLLVVFICILSFEFVFYLPLRKPSESHHHCLMMIYLVHFRVYSNVGWVVFLHFRFEHFLLEVLISLLQVVGSILAEDYGYLIAYFDLWAVVEFE